VTTADLKQGTFVGIHAVYPDKPHSVIELGRYFVALEDAWRACRQLASQNPGIRDAMRAGTEALVREESDHLDDLVKGQDERITQIATFYSWFDADEEEVETFSQRLDQLNEDANAELDSEFARIKSRLLASRRLDSLSLTVSRLRIESPMDLTLAVAQAVAPGGAITAVAIYSVHLLVRVMRDPERVGACLPRLLAGWHKGMTEAERARLDHARAEAERKKSKAIEDASGRLIAAAEKIKELPAAEATAIGAGDTPDDIVAALSE
jgi:hypothetical protein